MRKEPRSRSSVDLLDHYIVPKKQGAKRHYGLHPYFTRRPWNVVQQYIEFYAPKPGSIILDPFGGSGVTAVEAAVLGHTGIHSDINPLANFISECLGMVDVKIPNLLRALSDVEENVLKIRRSVSVTKALKDYWYPKNVRLSKNADVDFVHELFTTRQLADLAILRSQIKSVRDRNSRKLLLLAFSSTLAKTNRTFVSAKNRAASRGGATILSLYRYHVPNEPVELDVMTVFVEKVKRVVSAKLETNSLFADSNGKVIVMSDSATELSSIKNKSVDYIFTDPPYGSFINYLDLSAMWNAWLEFEVSQSTRASEVIEHGTDTDRYFDLMQASAESCNRVLKPGHFLSLVFCHRDLSYWRRLIEVYESAGFSYMTSVPQPLNAVWSMHKKKSDLSTIAGELIITFKNTRGVSRLNKPKGKIDIGEIVRQATQGLPATTTDNLYLNLIPRLLESGAIDLFSKKGTMIEALIREHLYYCPKRQLWIKVPRA